MIAAVKVENMVTIESLASVAPAPIWVSQLIEATTVSKSTVHFRGIGLG